jgi:adenylylsulfate kinase
MASDDAEMDSGVSNTDRNVVWQHATVTRQRREALNGHRSLVAWFTGLPSSGKSTIAHSVEERLHSRGYRTYTLDGDNIRHGLCADLGFSPADRHENLRRIGEVVKLFLDAGVIVLAAFVSPYRADRERLRALVGPKHFIEIYCQCPVEICEARDVKGMYRRARAGEIESFTGVSAPYEAPRQPDLLLLTHALSLEHCVQSVFDLIVSRSLLHTRVL